MANNVAAYNQQKYTILIQALLQEKLVAMDLANTSLISSMPNGTTINFPRPAYLSVQQYTKYQAVTNSNISSTDETLTINQTPIIAFEYDQIDLEDNAWNVIGNTVENSAFLLKEYVDSLFMNQALNFNLVYNGGTATALSSTNAVNTMLNAYATLTQQGIDTDNAVLVTDAFARNQFEQQAISSRFELGDEVFKRGYKGDVAGFMYYVSNNLTCVGTILESVNPTVGDTVTFGPVTFTFSATPTNPGDILVGISAAATAQYLTDAINQNGTVGTDSIALTQSQSASMRQISATLSGTTITVTSLRGYVGVSHSYTSASNKFGLFTIYAYAMEKGSIDLVLRDNVSMKILDVPGTIARQYLLWSRFGLKVFSQGAERGIIIPLVARAAD